MPSMRVNLANTLLPACCRRRIYRSRYATAAGSAENSMRLVPIWTWLQVAKATQNETVQFPIGETCGLWPAAM